ncbi:MAG: hypothetical protein JJ971_00835 [Balneolaceae bacterium]|nr:hypothetical protein [Balneolaceae bacterium]MBO6544915.1 hypothetical protein [Balneolaceae bacterium]MBO6646311.1 hypothetical protein [Balneolaceae bacterium]
MTELLYKTWRFFNLFIAIFVTLALYRASVQNDYEWGFFIISGTGLEGDFFWLLASVFASWCSYLLENWYKRIWFYVFPFVTLSTTSFLSIYAYYIANNLTFKGDALRIEFDLGLIFILITLGSFISFLFWMKGDFKQFQPKTLHLNRIKTVQLGVLLLLGIPIALFFADGNGATHSSLDRIAVFLTVLQGIGLGVLNDYTHIKEQIISKET